MHMSPFVQALRPGTEPTSELIVRDIKDSQIDKFARQCTKTAKFACEKSQQC